MLLGKGSGAMAGAEILPGTGRCPAGAEGSHLSSKRRANREGEPLRHACAFSAVYPERSRGGAPPPRAGEDLV